jgi:hypothetical protein
LRPPQCSLSISNSLIFYQQKTSSLVSLYLLLLLSRPYALFAQSTPLLCLALCQ